MMKNKSIKILRSVLATMFVIVFLFPLCLPLFYQSWRSHYYLYEIVVYVGILLILGIAFKKIEND